MAHSLGRTLVVGCTVAGMFVAAGVVAANNKVKIEGAGAGKAKISCPGGMSRLGHAFEEGMPIFPGDPEIHIEDVYTVADDFFEVEDIGMGAHAGTHIDAPAHFIGPPWDPQGRYVDELAAEEFVWPAYKVVASEIDTSDSGVTDDDGNVVPLVDIDDLEAYEDEHGDIENGSLVILQSGAEAHWGPNLFDFENAGFSDAAVQWLFDERGIAGLGADAYGPDAWNDVNFGATYTALANDGIALVALANVDSISIRGDVIMAPAVQLTEGSGFPVDPLACHAKHNRHEH